MRFSRLPKRLLWRFEWFLFGHDLEAKPVLVLWMLLNSADKYCKSCRAIYCMGDFSRKSWVECDFDLSTPFRKYYKKF
jgi:hypothetical protein